MATLVGGVRVDLRTGAATGPGGQQQLPDGVLALLRVLWLHRDRVVGTEELARALHPGAPTQGEAWDKRKNSIKQAKHQLEARLRQLAPEGEFVEAVRGVGLRLRPPVRTRLLGRQEVLAEVLGHLDAGRSVALVGLPGVGVGAVGREVAGSAGVSIGGEGPGVVRVEVPPLDEAAMGALVREWATRSGSPQAETLTAIVRASAGFPGFAARLVALLATEAEADVRRLAPDVRRRVIGAAVLRRWDVLPEAARRAVTAAATFVGRFTDDALDRVMPGAAAAIPELGGWIGGPASGRWVTPEARLLARTEAGPWEAMADAHAWWALGEAEPLRLGVRLGHVEAVARCAALLPELEAVATGRTGELRARALVVLFDAGAPCGSDVALLQAAIQDAPPAWVGELRLCRGLVLRRRSNADDVDLRAAVDGPVAEVRGRAWMALALRARDAGGREEALALLDRAEAEARSAGADWLRGRVAANRVHILGELGRSREADRAYGLAMQLAEAAGDRATIARTLGNRANLLRRRGEVEAAFEVSQREVAAFRALGDRQGLSVAVANQAAILLVMADRTVARERLLGAVEANADISPRAAATARLNLGVLCLAEGRLAEAGAHLALAREGSVEADDVVNEVRALTNRGAVLLADGRVDAGVEMVDQALALARDAQLADIGRLGAVLTYLARVSEGRREAAPSAAFGEADWLDAYLREVGARGPAALREGPGRPDRPDIRYDVLRRVVEGLGRAPARR